MFNVKVKPKQQELDEEISKSEVAVSDQKEKLAAAREKLAKMNEDEED